MATQEESAQLGESGIAVHCYFFARYADLLGCTELQIELSRGATVAAAVDFVRAHVPGAQQLPVNPLVAKNQQHVQYDSVVEDGDELAFLPPLGGG